MTPWDLPPHGELGEGCKERDLGGEPREMPEPALRPRRKNTAGLISRFPHPRQGELRRCCGLEQDLT